ncbi:uncharacterized protein E5676_scaffold350G001410 [Cucumis melo var. makuwa]|uniref:Uncharacterized protein LOC103502406 n=2 Tax=Cucumis melo TaxID=3656 RepID=A0A1S3CM99_CUCME|nr:uncharacterized protein LOC103502406 [Cucumis melo]KAA0057852.1 uncharacterized protein E6C27_scaffold274G001390 [Cucumis melo var. makuwa]TYJ98535.1 uncharacterized protein E5676_scaffold350G001410 [Cucumis melo var. makuwa]
MEPDEGPAHLSLSPTFSSYSSGSCSLAEIAARVVREVGEEPFADADNYGWEAQGSVYRFRENVSTGSASEGVRSNDGGKNCDDDEEFEFAVLREPGSSTSSANEIFYNGQIKPVYPVFNMDLLLDNGSPVDNGLENLKKKPAVRRLPLRKLMNEERKITSFSSSGVDDLGGVPLDSYCVWSPSPEKTSPGKRNKRNSTASSNRWKFRDLLYNNSRSKSEREDELVKRKSSIMKNDETGNVSKGKVDYRSGFFTSFSAQNAQYGRNRSVKEPEKRRSYLPYRQHLVGCVADAKGRI